MLLSLLLTSAALAQDGYRASWEAARAMAAAGDHAGAAILLAELAASYPDEHDLALELGWQRFQAHDYEGARAAYTQAARLSHGGFDARLGLAFALLRLGRRDGAAHHFRRALGIREDARAREGLALATARTWHAGMMIELGGAISPSLSRSLSGWAGARGWLALDGGLEIALRYLGSLSQIAGQAYDQHQLHVAAGWRGADVGVWLHYGAVLGTGSGWNVAHTFGASMSWTGFGQLDLEASATLFGSNDVVLRGALSWLWPLGEHVAFGPLLAAQWEWETDTFRGSAGGAIRFAVSPLSLLLYGYAGDERRPSSLSDAWVLTTPETIRGGVGGRLSIELGGGWRLSAAYEWRRLQLSDGTTEADSHRFDLRLGVSF